MVRFGSISDWILNAFKFGNKSYFFRNSSAILGNSGPVWINVNQPYLLYNQIPQLKTIIDRKAKMFSNMELILVNSETGDKMEDVELKALINKPNVLQSFNSFLEEYKIQEQVFGNQFTYKNKPSNLTKYPVALWNISPKFIAPYLTGKVFDQTELDQIISYYLYQDNGFEKKYNTSDIMYTKINDLNNPVIGCSPITSLFMPLSNIKGAYEFRNVIINEKGAIGILSNKSKDGMGTIPLSKQERDEIERKYLNDYGISEGQKRIILTNSGLEWQPMTYPTKELMLFEEIDADFMTIIDHFGLNANLFANKNSTYENVKNGIKLSYQDTIQPEADKYAQSLSEFLNLPAGTRLIASFDHIPFVQSDKSIETDIVGKKVSSIAQLVTSGIITPDQAVPIINEITGIQIPAISDSLLKKLTSVSPLIANTILDAFTTNQLLGILGMPPIEGGDTIRNNNVQA